MPRSKQEPVDVIETDIADVQPDIGIPLDIPAAVPAVAKTSYRNKFGSPLRINGELVLTSATVDLTDEDLNQAMIKKLVASGGLVKVGGRK